MKKLIVLMLFLSSITCLAQKKDSVKYEKFVRLSQEDTQVFIQSLNEWRRLIIYDPAMKDEHKVQSVQAIDKFLTGLMPKIKLDSMVADKPKKK